MSGPPEPPNAASLTDHHALGVVPVPASTAVDDILRDYFRMTADRAILFSNRYYRAVVPVLQLSDLHQTPQDLSTPRSDLVQRLPAVVFIVTPDSCDSVTESKRLIPTISVSCAPSAVKILFLHGDTLSEEDTYSLIAWAQPYGIQVISSLVCADDGLSVPDQLERALECADWPIITLQESSHSDPRENHLVETRPDTKHVKIEESKSLNQSNRLRRSLENTDISRLVGDLLDADETDSDTSS